ncbi:MAG: choice-of-anchor D domain-containing protein [Ignavibacteriae bacterium]|nr:choice-of-anchor D domain-containing protein [Ignavibacteriota bacterium]
MSFVFCTAKAQRIEMPDGEAIVSVNIFTGSEVYRLITTKTTIYSSKLTKGIWSKSKQLYQTIPARKIVDAVFKSNEVGDIRNYAVLLDNGEIIVFTYLGKIDNFSESKSYPTPVQYLGNSSFRKIIFSDDISIQFGSTIYQTQQNVGTWKQDTAGLGKRTIADLTLDSSDDLFAATNKGIWKFDKVTSNWKQIGSKADTHSVSSVFCSRNGKMYAGTAIKGIWMSLDKGGTWVRDTAGIGNITISRFTDDTSNAVYATTGSNNSQLIRKLNGAISWERIDAGLRSFAGVQQVRITDIFGEATLELGTSFGCFTGMNFGESWQYSSLGIMAEEIYGVQFIGNTTVVSTGLGIFRKQGTSWTKVFPLTGFSGSRSLLRSDKAGISYFQLSSTGGSNNGQQGAIYSSHDNGWKWEIDTVGLSNVPSVGFFPSVFYADRNGRKQIIVSSATGFSLRLYSANPIWSIDTLGMGLEASSQIQAGFVMHTDFSMTNQYVGGVIDRATLAVEGSLLYKRSYTESVWTVDTMGLNKYPVIAITSGKLSTYCGTSVVNGVSSIFRKKDTRWEKIKSPPSAFSDVRAMAVDSSGTLYVAYSSVINQTPNRGVYATGDNGVSWLYAGLDSVTVRGLVATNEAVYAYSNRGTYKLSLQAIKAASIQFNIHEVNFNKATVSSSKDTIIHISNPGNDTLRVSNFYSSNPFINSFSVIPSQFTLAQGEGIDVKIRFSPSFEGIVSTTLRSVSNTIPDTILVTGEGIKPNAKIQFVSKSILFGSVATGKFTDTLIEVGNMGSDTLRVTNVSSTNSMFSCIPKSFIVPPFGNSKVTIRFAPTSSTTQNGQIRFFTNSGNDTIFVFGSGVVSSVLNDWVSDRVRMSVTPNPLSESASVHFALPANSQVRLNIVNSLGETVSTIYEGLLDAGEHHFPINISADGIYFVRLVSPIGVATVKVAVIL